eukprot:GEZU01005907.1.p1 GENE.GEZU01005907.1~~GEZU01005907.1.p1  ORF type:complete len:365 (-),score=65.50 GEZU01005907.1:31-993(-)
MRLRSKLLSQQFHIVTPGEVITTEPAGYLRGHGTFIEGGKLIASVCGVVERVNKLITVRPLNARYTGEIGDVVVGRITEVAANRWKVDIQGRTDAVLLLSSINLPGGVHRRRNYEDQLNMRQLFVENDLISAEVQQFFAHDGSVSLHTRSLKYGKLGKGQFVRVPSALVKRCKQHFHTFPFGVEVILGNNGYIWIQHATSAPTVNAEGEAMDDDEAFKVKTANTIFNATAASQAEIDANKEVTVSPEIRERICRVRNAILVLSKLFIAIHPATIIDVYEASKHLPAKDMLSAEVMPLIAEPARMRNELKAKAAIDHQRDQ